MHHSEQKMCTFLFWMVQCGICDRCIVGFVNLAYCSPIACYDNTLFHLVLCWTSIHFGSQFTCICTNSVLVYHILFYGIHLEILCSIAAQSLGTDVWCACLTFCPPSHSCNKTSYLTRWRACVGRGGAAVDETKISRARFVEKSQWFRC